MARSDNRRALRNSEACVCDPRVGSGRRPLGQDGLWHFESRQCTIRKRRRRSRSVYVFGLSRSAVVEQPRNQTHAPQPKPGPAPTMASLCAVSPAPQDGPVQTTATVDRTETPSIIDHASATNASGAPPCSCCACSREGNCTGYAIAKRIAPCPSRDGTEEARCMPTLQGCLEGWADAEAGFLRMDARPLLTLPRAAKATQA